jgi:carotenoid cleavage dioxygenase-like enzyme
VAGRSPLRASWVHSIAASERYVVLVEQPAYFNLLALLTGRLSSYTIFDW